MARAREKKTHLLMMTRNDTIQEVERHVLFPYGSGNVTALQCPPLATSGLKPCTKSELQDEELASFREQDRSFCTYHLAAMPPRRHNQHSEDLILYIS